MRHSSNRILTTHVGSLARPANVLDLLWAKERREAYDTGVFEAAVRDAVTGIVKRQRDLGIDVVNDGEQSKSSFLTYIAERLTGFSPSEKQGEDLWVESRETIAFPEFYDAHRKAREGLVAKPVKLVCTGPVADCGFASFAAKEQEIHPSIVWAKFKNLAEGARIASKQLWA